MRERELVRRRVMGMVIIISMGIMVVGVAAGVVVMMMMRGVEMVRLMEEEEDMGIVLRRVMAMVIGIGTMNIIRTRARIRGRGAGMGMIEDFEIGREGIVGKLMMDEGAS